MKNILFILILPMLLFSACKFASSEKKNETPKKSVSKTYTQEDAQAELKKWEASPDGINFKNWKMSPEGKKVHFSIEKIRNSLKDFSPMEGVITSLSLPPGSRLGFGLMVKINGYDYILAFGPEKSGKNSLNNEFTPLHQLKVNDKIIIKSHNVSFAPKYAFPIISGDFIAQDSKIIFVRVFPKNGC